MKKIWNILKFVILGVYIVVALFTTVCLLKRNDYIVTELGNNSLLIIKDDDKEYSLEKDSLYVVDKNTVNDAKVGDNVFFYNQYNHEVSVNVAKVLKVENINENEKTFTMAGDLTISSQNVIGVQDTSKCYASVGGILNKLESKWGFLGLIILPILVLFIYQIYAVIMEIKRPVDEE